MVQRQPEQERHCDDVHVQQQAGQKPSASQASSPDQRDPLTTPPIGYDEAIAGHEPDGGESLLVGAPREGEAKQVDKASQEKRYPQVHEPRRGDSSDQSAVDQQ